MKHQYFGDINDYRKYGILRTLAQSGIRSTICWMLTKDDGRSDGRHIGYLQKSEQFRSFDPPLFDALRDAVFTEKKRRVDWVSKRRLISSATYFNPMVSDENSHRQAYFDALSKAARHTDLIFFDPDNGIEVKSKPKGKKDSNKYLYWDEVEQFWNLGYSLLIYQHFPRVNRLKYIRFLSDALCSRTGSKEVTTLKTSSVAFFLLAQSSHRKKLHAAAGSIQQQWHGMIEVLQ
jgi:hypothetical protein